MGDDNGYFFNCKMRPDLNSKIMVPAIISLSFVVILVAFLHIYARCVLRRRRRRRLSFMSQTDQLVFFTTGQHPSKTGLDVSVIAALPLFVFKQTTAADGTLECAVCLSLLEDGEKARTLPNCKHTFHAECIDKWLDTNLTCPVCRCAAKPARLVPEPREGMVVNPPSAPPVEGTSSDGAAAKLVGGSNSRLSSFRRMLSGERSSGRTQTQSCGHQEDGLPDLERQ